MLQAVNWGDRPIGKKERYICFFVCLPKEEEEALVKLNDAILFHNTNKRRDLISIRTRALESLFGEYPTIFIDLFSAFAKLYPHWLPYASTLENTRAYFNACCRVIERLGNDWTFPYMPFAPRYARRSVHATPRRYAIFEEATSKNLQMCRIHSNKAIVSTTQLLCKKCYSLWIRLRHEKVIDDETPSVLVDRVLMLDRAELQDLGHQFKMHNLPPLR